MPQILIETLFLPPIPIVKQFVNCTGVIVEAHENYQKRSFRNRIHLAGPHSVESFSIPLSKGKNEQQTITSTQISYMEDWTRTLARLLQGTYGSAPFYHHYIDELLHIFNKKEASLFDLNFDLLNWVWKRLQLSTPLTKSVSYQLNSDDSTVTDLRNQYGRNYIWPKENIVTYNQVYEDKQGFVPHLSILDMIMCCGPESTSLLMNPQ